MFFDASEQAGHQRGQDGREAVLAHDAHRDVAHRRRRRRRRGSSSAGAASPGSSPTSARSRRSTRCSPPDGLPIRATCQVTLEELAGDAPKQNPTSGGLRAAPRAPGGRGRQPAGDRLPRVRAAGAVAGRGRPQRGRRPDAAAPGRPAAAAAAGGAGRPRQAASRPAIAAPRRGRSMAHGEEFSNTILVTVDGTPLPDDVKPLLVNGYVDDSTNVPDLFVLRFSDDGGTVLAKAQVRDRREGRAQPPVHGTRRATACSSRARSPRSRWRSARRACTRWCGASTRRTGCSAAPGSRPTST